MEGFLAVYEGHFAPGAVVRTGPAGARRKPLFSFSLVDLGAEQPEVSSTVSTIQSLRKGSREETKVVTTSPPAPCYRFDIER